MYIRCNHVKMIPGLCSVTLSANFSPLNIWPNNFDADAIWNKIYSIIYRKVQVHSLTIVLQYILDETIAHIYH